MILVFAIFLYVAAIVLANISIFSFGPWVSPINAFFFIGLDLALRDWLHVRIDQKKMMLLITLTMFVTYALNPEAGQIALASAIAFGSAAFVDYLAFTRLRGSWLYRSNGSNIAGAFVDSIVFPTLAFGVLMPGVVLLQFFAKIAGGAVWSMLLSRIQIGELYDTQTR